MRGSVELERTTLADWVGGAGNLRSAVGRGAPASRNGCVKLHADDTPVPVLFPAWGEERKQADCGHVSVMTGPQRTPRRLGGSRTLQIAKTNIPKASLAPLLGHAAGDVAMRGSTKCMKRGAFVRPRVGRMSEESSTIFRSRTIRRRPKKLSSGSGLCTILKARSVAVHRRRRAIRRPGSTPAGIVPPPGWKLLDQAVTEIGHNGSGEVCVGSLGN